MTLNGKDNIVKVKKVAATMAIEDMYLPKEFLQQMIKVANGELSSESIREAVIKKYARK